MVRKPFLNQSPNNYLTLMQLDGKQTKIAMQQTAIDVGQMKCLHFLATSMLSVESYASL
jgi:hypothetical protein